MHWLCPKSGVGRAAVPCEAWQVRLLKLPLVGHEKSNISFGQETETSDLQLTFNPPLLLLGILVNFCLFIEYLFYFDDFFKFSRLSGRFLSIPFLLFISIKDVFLFYAFYSFLKKNSLVLWSPLYVFLLFEFTSVQLSFLISSTD